jgi:hypothetical protein
VRSVREWLTWWSARRRRVRILRWALEAEKREQEAARQRVIALREQITDTEGER